MLCRVYIKQRMLTSNASDRNVDRTIVAFAAEFSGASKLATMNAVGPPG